MFVRDAATREALVAAAEEVAEKYNIPIYGLEDGTASTKHPPGSSPASRKPFATRLSEVLANVGELIHHGFEGVPSTESHFDASARGKDT